MAGLLGIKTISVTSSEQVVTIPLSVNAGENARKAYMYLISFHSSSGDATHFEYGILRLGYSGGNVTKYKLSSKLPSDVDFTMNSNTDGYLQIKSGSSTNNYRKRILIMG